MTETIEVIAISTLGCLCIYLFTKLNRSGPSKSTSSETIPLLEERESQLRNEKAKQEKLLDELAARSKKVEKREAELKDAEETVESKAQKLESRVSEVESKAKQLESREDEIESKAQKLEIREKELKAKEEKLGRRENEVESKAVLVANDEQESTTVIEEEEPSPTATDTTGEQKEPAQSEAEKRKTMIEEELERLIKQTNETELSEEEPFDDDSAEALKKAAIKICYTKKYYDVMNDKFIYFPSVAKTALDYRLMEEAEKHYFEEEDEYPADLSGGLRAVAFAIISEEEDDDMDEDYMSALAQDIEI